MVYRLLLIGVLSVNLSACFWDDYEKSNYGSSEIPPTNDNETLPDSGQVVNGSLESSNDAPLGWSTLADTGAANFEISSAQYYSGSQSLKISLMSLGDTLSSISAGPTNVEVEDGTYYFSGWVLGTNGAAVTFAAHPSGDAAAPLATQEVNVISSWQRVAFEFVVPPGVTSLDLPVYLSHAQNAGAAIYLDSFALKGGGGDLVELPIKDGLAGWSTDQATNTLSFDEELGLVITPDTAITNQVAMYTLAEPINPEGLEFSFVVNIPAEYKEAGIALQPYIQEEGDDYSGDFSGYTTDFEAGTNVIIYRPQTPPPLIQRIGLQVIGGTSALADITGISISKVYFPGGDGDSGPDLPLSEGWAASNGSPVYSSAGVSYSPTATDQSLTFMIEGPNDLEGARLVYTITLDEAFVTSGADLQPFAQQNFDPWTGAWGCYFANNVLVTGSAEYSCTLDDNMTDGVAPFNIGEGQQLRVGVQAKGTPAGTVTITDVQIEYPMLPVDSGWRASEGLAPPVYDDGVEYAPTAIDHHLLTDVAGAKNLEGATFVFTIEASEAFIASGADLQPYAQVKVGDWPGEWNCWIGNADLSTSPKDHRCVLQAADFNLLAGQEMQIGVQAKGMAPAGTIKITAVRFIYAE